MMAAARTTVARDGRSLVETLQDWFGFDSFREGQKEIVEATLQGRDTAVIWATGRGKSLCFQLPALHVPDAMVVVVSPLISLMQDQVIRFNERAGATGSARAACLGSFQMDPGVEAAVLRREYRLVYVTPEKLTSTFAQQLQTMHRRKPLTLLAVDEAHCVSEWGHDFRPAFQAIGQTVKEFLPGCPVMCLTATATQKVREDIFRSLQLVNPLVSVSTFDRPNLKISVSTSGATLPLLGQYLDTLQNKKQSTIVYCRTIKDTEAVCQFIRRHWAKEGVTVDRYHGSLGHAERQAVHHGFLAGQLHVVVATVAFGMGIDKPDIRLVVHYGPPKTMEEYYQHTGRAGRDGLQSACHMLCTASQFQAYLSDFYLGGLSTLARNAVETSLAALRKFCVTRQGCRRKMILDHFADGLVAKTSFGAQCGSCDLCLAGAAGSTATIDYTKPAQVLLAPLALGGNATRTALLDKVRGTRIDGFAITAQNRAFWASLLDSLDGEGYLLQTAKQGAYGSYMLIGLSRTGVALLNGNRQAVLPIPEAELQRQRAAEERLQANATRLKGGLASLGIDPSVIPAVELASGGGPVTAIYKQWIAHLKRAPADRQARLTGLKGELMALRQRLAAARQMAPASVFADHVVFKLAYSTPTTEEGLRAAGVRLTDPGQLLELLRKARAWNEAASPGAEEVAIALPPGLFTPKRPWRHAVYSTLKNGAKKSWEVSYDRFCQGEGTDVIAVSQPTGRVLQESTIVGHVLQALEMGKPVDLRRLVEAAASCPPTVREWKQLDEAASSTGMDPVADVRFDTREVLRTFLPAAETEWSDRGEEEKQEYNMWAQRVRWWLALLRVGWTIPADRQAVAPKSSPAAPAAPTASGETAPKRAKPTLTSDDEAVAAAALEGIPCEDLFDDW